MAIEIVDLPIKNSGFPLNMVIFPLKIVIFLLKIVVSQFANGEFTSSDFFCSSISHSF